MKKIRFTALMLTLTMLLCSCSAMLDRDYYVSAAHDELYKADVDSGAIIVENYSGLKSALLSQVEQGIEEVTFRFYNYETDVVTDVGKVISEVKSDDPLGAYAVRYMTVKSTTRVVSYYESIISIVYRENLGEVVRVSGIIELEQTLLEAMQSFNNRLVVRMSYYSDTDIESMIDNIYDTYPLVAVGCPSVSISLYPSTGILRIADISFDYPLTSEELLKRQNKLESDVRTISSTANYITSDKDRAYRLYKRMSTYSNAPEYDFESAELFSTDGELPADSLSDTAYGAIVGKLAVSAGFAKAFMLLSETCNIECRTITGKKNGEPHTWNIITIDGYSYHVDCTSELTLEGDICFLRSDDEMEGYRWNTELYPECNGPLKLYDVDPSAAPEPAVEATLAIDDAEEGDDRPENQASEETSAPAPTVTYPVVQTDDQSLQTEPEIPSEGSEHTDASQVETPSAAEDEGTAQEEPDIPTEDTAESPTEPTPEENPADAPVEEVIIVLPGIGTDSETRPAEEGEEP